MDRSSRAGELRKLHTDMNNPNLSKFVRRKAHYAFYRILEQLKDRKLMDLREQLIRATRAGDQEAARRIELRMRDHEHELDKETGIPDYVDY